MSQERRVFAKWSPQSCSGYLVIFWCHNFPLICTLHLQGNCTRENHYGFKAGRPCILLKLNKIIGWEPEVLDAKYLPEDIPEHIAEDIKKNNEEGKEKYVSEMT